MSEKITVAKAERMQNTIERQRNKLEEGARLGQSALVTGLGGGVVAGYLEAKYPTLLGTSLPSVGVGGALLVVGALTGVFESYSDPLCSLGSGMLSVAIAKEAQAYFAS